MPEPAPRTQLAALRQKLGVSQQDMSWATGLSVATYQRLERGEITNPPLRYLVNCAIALEVDLDQVIEAEWRQWRRFSARATDPPKKSWWRGL